MTDERTLKERFDEAQLALDEFEATHSVSARTVEAGKPRDLSGFPTLELAREHEKLTRARDEAQRAWLESI